LILALASSARAQVELTGTYVRYVATGLDGTMICDSGACMGHSMQYQEDAASTPSCDLFYRGNTLESFTIEATTGQAPAPKIYEHGIARMHLTSTRPSSRDCDHLVRSRGRASLRVDVDRIPDARYVGRRDDHGPGSVITDLCRAQKAPIAVQQHRLERDEQRRGASRGRRPALALARGNTRPHRP
jgi:hypothetical protein